MQCKPLASPLTQVARSRERGHTFGALARCLRHRGWWVAARRCTTTARRRPASSNSSGRAGRLSRLSPIPIQGRRCGTVSCWWDRVVEFARSELGLDAGNSYRRYAALDEPFVVWNVFAAPPLSFDGHRWCYPFVGCVPYRGFFDQRAALRAEAGLVRRGYETHVAGVAAYSTLGWFDDPLLSTFIDWPEPRLAELLLHEISHRRIWVRDDPAFNESFAAFAGETGARLWFRQTGREAEFDRYVASRQGWRRFRALLLATRAQLESGYRKGGAEERRYREKARVLETFRRCYRHHKPSLGGGAFDSLVDEVNNAYLVALGAYSDWYPAFAALHRRAGGWTAFLEAVDALAGLAREERTAALEATNPKRHARDGEFDPMRCLEYASL